MHISFFIRKFCINGTERQTIHILFFRHILSLRTADPHFGWPVYVFLLTVALRSFHSDKLFCCTLQSAVTDLCYCSMCVCVIVSLTLLCVLQVISAYFHTLCRLLCSRNRVIHVGADKRPPH